MRSFRCIQINGLNGLRFLAEVSTNLQKCTIFDSLRTITQDGKTRQTAHFLIKFLSSLWYSFLYLKILKIHFHGVCKNLNFGGESCKIRILSRSIQETYTLRKLKKQVLLFLLSWEPNLSDLMVYDCSWNFPRSTE